MLSCTFDPLTRSLASTGAARHVDIVCPHLAPGLEYLLAQGSTVVEVNRMAWSLIDLDIVLDKAADPRSLPAIVGEDAGAETWVNFDPHYPLAHGLVCGACRQALAWPHQRDPEDS
jgi:hypothetical protein